MKLVDLNVLLYAVNEDAPYHRAVRVYWEKALSGDEPVGLAWITVLGFLRLVTSAAVFPRPLPADAAAERVDRWLSTGTVRIVREKEDHWDFLRPLLRQTGTAGNLTTDTHLAAIAISYGAVLASCDADFARFPGLRWENPLAPGKPTRRKG